jgi:hypothetical protein
MSMLLSVLKRYESLRPFTESEAWLLFRIAALGEAFGWTLLIIGILTQRYLTPGNDTAVLIAGQIHGTIFFVYLVAAIALLASVPPYGTLLIEQWATHRRHSSGFKTYRHFLLYTLLLTASN